MATLAEKLKQQLFGINKPSVMSSAPIRNSRSKNFSSTDPFADTENNKYAYGTLRYPDNLGEYEYGHYLLFHIFQVSQSKYAGPQTEVEEIDLSKYGMGGGVAGGKIKRQNKFKSRI